MRPHTQHAPKQHRETDLTESYYTAATEEAALERFVEFADAWGKKCPAIVRLWENAWEEFTPFPWHTWLRATCAVDDR